MLSLAALLSHLQGAQLVRGDPATEVRGVVNDTRRLQPGDLFVAVPGYRLDAHDLIPEAISRGAAAIVAERDVQPDVHTPYVVVPSARATLADLSAAIHGHPSRLIPVVGITGTDGKTSTTHLLSAILEARDLRTGWLTTVNTKIGDQVRPNAADHTTPEAPFVQATLAEMVQANLDVAILETSSHALELDRVRGTKYRVGVFTNLSPEHLNFHGTFEAYRDAKARLFRSLPAQGLAVLNADDPNADCMRTATIAPVLTYALDTPAHLRATDVHLTPSGTTFTLLRAWGRSPQEENLPPLSPRGEGGRGERGEILVSTQLIGRFNVANWLAAFGAATYFGATLEHLRLAAERQEPVPGRMNLVAAGQPFAVVVDFAHTPQALEKALDTVRSLVPGRVLLVFGLAGGRDFHNRPVMGALAARKADFFVISMDDPGEEDPLEIAHQIARGAEAAGAAEGERFIVDVDRRSAIHTVLTRARPDDVVLLAGKGHEERMVVGQQKLPWNDARVARQELAALGFHA